MNRSDPPGPPGRWGLALLAAAGVAGLVLAVHGWSARGPGLPPGALAPGTAPASGARPPGGTPPASGARPAPGAASSGRGPLLRSQPYASAAYQVWPGPRSAAARAALTGLRVTVRRDNTGLKVAAGVIGQAPPPPRRYPAGARVYIVEYTLGDDSAGTDYNLGDDALVITDAGGRIIR